MGIRDVFADTRPLSNPAYRRLWTANIFTQLGAQLTVVAVPTHIYSLTGSSAYVGLTGLFGLVPLIVFGLYGGSIADAFDKRKVLIVTTLGMTLSAAGMWAMTLTGAVNVWWLLALFALQQAFFAVNQPTRTAVIRRLLPLDQLAAGSSLNMTLMQAGAIVGPLIAGALIPLTGYAWLYFIDLICLVPTLGAVLALSAMAPTGTTVERAGLRSVISGLRYLGGHPVLLVAMLLDLLAMSFGMPRALYPEMAEVDFGGSPMMLSALYSSLAVGAVLGGLFSGWITREVRQGKAVTICIVVWGLAVTIAGIAVMASPGAVTGWAVLVVVMLVVGGAADMFSASLRNAITQQSTTDEMQGRVQGAYFVIVAGGPRIADVLHGWAAGWWGAGLTTAVGGVLAVVSTVVCVALVPKFWRYRRPTPDVDAGSVS